MAKSATTSKPRTSRKASAKAAKATPSTITFGTLTLTLADGLIDQTTVTSDQARCLERVGVAIDAMASVGLDHTTLFDADTAAAGRDFLAIVGASHNRIKRIDASPSELARIKSLRTMSKIKRSIREWAKG